jgi:hypothetical protein
LKTKEIHFILSIFTLYSCYAYAGEWTRVSPDSISLSGEIQEGEFRRFMAIYQETDHTLIVNSTGGNMAEGLRIGQVVLRAQMDVIIRGICASSCANYLFLAGRRKVLDHGFVGFHGNWLAYARSPRFEKDKSDVPPDKRDQFEKYQHLAAEMIPQETQFFRQIGVSQEFFDKTQIENDNGLYDIFIPSPTTFSKYGMKNIEGEEDLNVLRSMPGFTIRYE